MVQLLLYIRAIIMSGIQVYRYILLGYFLLSWLPGAYQSVLGQWLIRLCEPFVSIFRRFIPPIGMISLAGLAAYVSLFFFETGVDSVTRLLIQMLS